MRKTSTLVALGAVALATPALAHDVICDKTVRGEVSAVVQEYPATLHYAWKLTNVADAPSTVTHLADTMNPSLSSEAPLTIPVGESAGGAYDVTIGSYEDCVALAASNACGAACGAGVVDNVLSARFDQGEAQCRARVVCLPPPPECGTPGQPPCPPPPGGATRTLGFFKTHVVAVEACLASGPIDLGFVTLTTPADVLGLLWGSVPRFDSGSARNALDQARFLLGRQTAVAACNERLFGTSSGGRVAQAVAALATTSCASIQALVTPVDAFNNVGDANPFPAGFNPGPATPTAAVVLADDRTVPSAQTCTP